MATASPSNGTNEHERATQHADEEQKYILNVGWKVLFGFTTRRQVPVILCGIASTTVAALTMPAFAIFYGLIFGQYTMYGAGSIDSDTLMSNMAKYCVILAGICALNWVASSFHYFFFLTFSELQARGARNRIFDALLKKDMAWFDTRKTGIAAFLPTVQAHIRDLQLSLSSPLSELSQAIIQSLAAMGVAFYFSWKLTLVVMSSVPLLYLALTLVANRQSLRAREQSEKLQSALRCITTAVSSIEAVKSFNGERHELHNFKKTSGLAARLYRRVANLRSMQIGIMQFFTISIFVQGFWYGKYLVDNGDGDAAHILTTFWAVLMAMSCLASTMPQLVVLNKGQAAGANLTMLMKQISASDQQLELRGNVKPTMCLGDIEFRNVTFSYLSRAEDVAIRDVSLFIPAGETTFIIGKSGSGKSTLGQLLLRLYRPSSGQVLLDGVSIERLDVHWLRRNVTLVEQHSVLFNDTIHGNIALGNPDEDVHVRDVLNAVKFSKLDQDLQGLPDGLDTELGLKGGSMSGGQKQRLALARAKIRNSPVLILDESASALDSITKAEIYEAIRKWRKGKTTLIITHDIAQIRSNDFLYLLNNAEVIQEGYRKELEAQGGYFYAFIESHEEEESGFSEGDDDDAYKSIPPKHGTQTIRNSFADTKRSLEVTRGNAFSDAEIFMSKEIGLGLESVALNRTSCSDFNERRSSLSKEFGLRPDAMVSREPPSHTSQHPQPLSMPDSLPVCPESLKKHSENNRIRPRIRRLYHKTCTPSNSSALTESLSLSEILTSVWPAITWRSRTMIFGAFLCTLIHSACTPVFAWVFARLLSTFQEPASQSHHKTRNYALAILGVATADGLSKYLMFFLSDAVAQAWSLSLKTEAMRRILLQPREFFNEEENSTSRLAETLDHFAEEARNLPGRFACIFLAMVLMITISISWSMAISWKLALVALATGPVLFVITKCNNMISNRWETLSSQADDKVGEILHETFVNIRTVRCLGLENHFRKKYRHATSEAVKLGIKRAIYSGSIFGLAFTGVIFMAILLYWYGALLMSRDEYTASKVMECFLILMLSINYISSLAQYITQINISRDAGTRLLRLARLPTDSHELAGKTSLSYASDISLENVNFTYPTRKHARVIHDVSFTIPRGSCTAIVGSSGSGKSTIASLLLKLYQIDDDQAASSFPHQHAGQLRISNKDIRTIDTTSLRSRIAIVSQTPVLFPGTIAQNIAYGLSPSAPETSMASIRAAADAAGISDFIDSLAQGYNTLVGDGGTGLSGGQAQRLAIARALVRNPDILILDEATSALDIASANMIRDTVLRLVGRRKRGSAASTASSRAGSSSSCSRVLGGTENRECSGMTRVLQQQQSASPDTSAASLSPVEKDKDMINKRMTVIIITHAREMMAIADHVVMLHQGRVVEEGGFQELKRKRGSAFGRLLRGEMA